MLMHQKLHSQSQPIKILYHVGDREALLGWVRVVLEQLVCTVEVGGWMLVVDPSAKWRGGWVHTKYTVHVSVHYVHAVFYM